MNAMRQPTTAPPPGQPYVLLVENEVEDEALAQRILKKYRIANHVEWAKDGEEAVKLLRERLASPSPASAPGRSSGETTQVLTRSRTPESAPSRASLLPSPEAAPRSPEGSPSRPGESRIGNGLPPLRTTRTPELVLIAFEQERLTVLETVARLRALPGMDNVPVAVLCRTPDQERQVRESPLPRLSSLSKPIGFFKLLECIQRMDMHWFVFSEKP